jgi:hypothetical protein
MNGDAWRLLNRAALLALLLGVVGCAIGVAIDGTAFYPAWLCAFLFWLGLPLGGVTLVLVHDLTGGEWMATARPALNAAITAMPIATLAGIPAFVGLHSLYGWTHASGLDNAFYLNSTAFLVRYAGYIAVWNLLAAFALWGPRAAGDPIAPALSWLSAFGLILLAFSVSFAAIDWILSLQPKFWSSVFPMTIGANWFNTGFALVLLVVAVAQPPVGARRDHMADLAAILLATAIFWAYVEFVQFLIIWEEDLKSEIAWYLPRLHSLWRAALFVAVGLGFFIPFFTLLWRPAKRNRSVVAAVCTSIVISRVAYCWWLILPAPDIRSPLWLAAAAMLALGGVVLLAFIAALRRGIWIPRMLRHPEAGYG